MKAVETAESICATDEPRRFVALPPVAAGLPKLFSSSAVMYIIGSEEDDVACASCVAWTEDCNCARRLADNWGVSVNWLLSLAATAAASSDSSGGMLLLCPRLVVVLPLAAVLERARLSTGVSLSSWVVLRLMSPPSSSCRECINSFMAIFLLPPEVC